MLPFVPLLLSAGVLVGAYALGKRATAQGGAAPSGPAPLPPGPAPQPAPAPSPDGGGHPGWLPDIIPNLSNSSGRHFFPPGGFRFARHPISLRRRWDGRRWIFTRF